jgi:hypothetical protein
MAFPFLLMNGPEKQFQEALLQSEANAGPAKMIQSG